MPCIVMTAITMITQPLLACICAWMLVLGRLMYTAGYHNFGPKGRIPGAILVDLSLIASLVGGFITVATWDNKTAYLVPSGATVSF